MTQRADADSAVVGEAIHAVASDDLAIEAVCELLPVRTVDAHLWKQLTVWRASAPVRERLQHRFGHRHGVHPHGQHQILSMRLDGDLAK